MSAPSMAASSKASAATCNLNINTNIGLARSINVVFEYYEGMDLPSVFHIHITIRLGAIDLILFY